MALPLTELGTTFIFDLDGVLVKHNGHKTSEGDRILSGVKEFFAKLDPQKDQAIIVTAREDKYSRQTEQYLHQQGLWWTVIIYNATRGPRVLINDNKPAVPEKHLPKCHTTFHLEVDRDKGLAGAYEQIKNLTPSS